MKRSTDAATGNFKMDERAWMGFSFAEGNLTLTLNKSFLVPTELVNTGKTPAQNVHGDIVVGVFGRVNRLTSPMAQDTRTTAWRRERFFPGGKIVESFEAIRHGQRKAEPIIFTAPVKDEIFSGGSFIVVRGRIEYNDIFGTEHWTTYCRYILHPELISDECTRYNGP